MKPYYPIILIFLFLSTSLFAQNTQCPFNKGFNLGQWFEQDSPTSIKNLHTITELENMKMLGADHLRLPITLFNLSGDAPDYTLDPILFLHLDRVVDWAEELGMHLILDNHSGGVTDTANTKRLVAVWQQMAARYKNRSNLVLYEIQNEPYNIDDNLWGEMQGKAIDAIRAIDTVHTIIVSPAGMGSFYNLTNLPVYEDDNLIYTFHYYEPFLYTHQGSNWTTPSMADFIGVPYPYDSVSMPEMPAEFAGTWLADAYENYKTDGNKEYNELKADIPVQFRTDRQVPLYCGEVGALQSGSTKEDREQWTQDIADIFTTREISWSMWGYGGGFGIFNEGTRWIFPDDLDTAIVEALGLTMPPTNTEISPDTSEIIIYDDLSNPRITDVTWMGPNPDYYVANAAQGDYCIRWTEATQYHTFGWELSTPKDFSILMENNFVLKFWIKTSSPDLSIDFRFNDTDLQDGVDHPWRMSKTINNTLVQMDGEWHEVEIRLKDMVDSGSWHNENWYGSEGKFDWSRIATLQFVLEHHDLGNTEVYIDDVRIVKGAINTAIEPEICDIPNSLNLLETFPNPFKTKTTFRFSLNKTENVDLRIYNTSGSLVRILHSGELLTGYHNIEWDAKNEKGILSPNSVYIYVLKVGQQIHRGKIILSR